MIQQIAAPTEKSSIFDTSKTGAVAKKNAAATTTTSGTSPSSATDSIGSTFLNLLVQELQNQDPTDPMDSTAMVGQMISLNQLDQLTSINQILGGNTGTLNGASSSGATTTAQGAPATAGTQSSKSSTSPLDLSITSAQPFFPS